MSALLIATQNPKKVAEINQVLKGLNISVEPITPEQISEEIPETGSTLRENALQKARYVYHKLQRTCFADDTGLMVEALGGEPGVFSARYAGNQKNSDDNMNLLLKNLSGAENRKAKFVTVIALVGNGIEEIFEGEVEGEIILEKRGEGGFGYDPIFVPTGYSETFAEMSADEKNKISHRARALQKLLKYFEKKSE
jgi:XTP/dITP diphosphohydrolase